MYGCVYARENAFAPIRARGGKTAMQEKYIERKLRDMVKEKGGMALKFVSPGTDGVPDRLVLLPGGSFGRR